MGNLGMTEILIIMVIILLLFGAKRIPEIAGSFGKGINEFKRNIGDAQRAVMEPPRDEARTIAPGQAPVTAAPNSPEDEVARQPKRLIG
jgi:sec-independent protein translocase protein TatA